jgi:hypothetical protein
MAAPGAELFIGRLAANKKQDCGHVIEAKTQKS